MTTSKFNLADYLPGPEVMDPAAIQDSRARLEQCVKAWWPELDTRPGSVFGDLHLAPLATLLASLEDALRQRDRDTDLDAISRGLVTDPDLARTFLANFGVTETSATKSNGLARLVFAKNQDVSLDPDMRFQAGNSLFNVVTKDGAALVIRQAGTAGARYVLTAEAGQFVVYVPLQGTPGSSVKAGTAMTYGQALDGLVGITAAGDFDSGVPALSLPQMAIRARALFTAGGLGTRRGAVGLLRAHFPGLVSAGAVITGDVEMSRDTDNILGLAQGAMDVLVRGSREFQKAAGKVTLTYDLARGAWAGRLDTPVTPAFFDLAAGVFKVSRFNNDRAQRRVLMRSLHPRQDSAGLAYSRHQQLGLLVDDLDVGNSTPASITPPVQISGTPAVLLVSGEYGGHVFSNSSRRDLMLQVERVAADATYGEVLVVSVKDRLSGESGEITLAVNSPSTPLFAVPVASGTYTEFFNGLALRLTPADNIYVSSRFVGCSYQLSFQGRSAEFEVGYLYDPTLPQVEALLEQDDYRPAAMSVLARGFAICHVSALAISYQVPFGKNIDLTAARQRMADYLNGLARPESYDSNRIAAIMLEAGASAVSAVAPQGIIYPSLATVFVDKQGVETSIPRIPTRSLLPPAGVPGLGARNLAYLIEPTAITFNATAR